jgi:HAD superfamily hydrolase (TIGR01549 family)
MQNIFLDAGGVILNEASHETARAALTVKIFVENGIPYSIEKYWEDIHESLSVYALHTYGFVFWKNTMDKAKYEILYSQYLKSWKELNVPLDLMENIENVLKYLSKKYKIGILGQYNHTLKEVLEGNDLLQYFTYSSTQEKYNITKPDPRYFEAILKDASAEPKESFMVGDRIDKDINPAKMIGMRTIRVKNGIYKNQKPRNTEEIADFEIENIKELIKIL